LHRVAGRPMLWYAARLARQVATRTVAIVVGHGSEQVQTYLDQEKANFEPFEVVIQEKQLGTGHAVQHAYPVCTRNDSRQADQFLILNGDTPLLTKDTLTSMLDYHQSQEASLTLLTTVIPEPRGYGRVVRGPAGEVCRIVEDRDASAEERHIPEINVGTYVVEAGFLGKALSQLRPQNAQGEFYITDIIEMAVQQDLKVVAWVTHDSLETTGINTREHLAVAEKEMRRRICQRLMLAGVTMLDPERVLVDDGVEVGRDTCLYPGVILEGRTVIGNNCMIHSNSRLNNSLVGNDVFIQDSCVLLGDGLCQNLVDPQITQMQHGKKTGKYKKQVLGRDAHGKISSSPQRTFDRNANHMPRALGLDDESRGRSGDPGQDRIQNGSTESCGQVLCQGLLHSLLLSLLRHLIEGIDIPPAQVQLVGIALVDAALKRPGAHSHHGNVDDLVAESIDHDHVGLGLKPTMSLFQQESRRLAIPCPYGAPGL